MSDDPFAFEENDDRTRLHPSRTNMPGGMAGDIAQGTMPHAYSGEPALLGGINRLENAASKLLPLLITIKNSSSHPDPDGLRNKLIRELEEFKKRARQILDDPKKVTQASYVMCTALDEATMNTPWGHHANWSQHNLLSTFHNEVFGGERFFSLLKGLGKNPKENIDLLELMYVCLSLGYEGTYRIASNGQETLVKVRQWLYEIIQSVRTDTSMNLSTQWEGSAVKERTLPRLTPLWVLLAASLAIASLAYITFKFRLAGQTENTIAGFFDAKTERLSVRTVAAPVQPVVNTTAPEQSIVTLTQLLQQEIDLGQLQVSENFEQGQIRLLGDSLFGSGKIAINSELEPLIKTIGDSLNQLKGRILVTGHSDNIPIRSGRFSSNLELSRARALNVESKLLESAVNPERVSAEGRGSLEPIADNATVAGRSDNRRVEITIFY